MRFVSEVMKNKPNLEDDKSTVKGSVMYKNLRINMYNVLFFALFLLILFPGWYFSIGNLYLRVPVIIALITLTSCMSLKFSSLQSNILCFLINKNFRIFFYWIIWVILSGLCVILAGRNTLEHYVSEILTRIFPLIIIPVFLGFTLAKKYDIEKIIKFYYLFVFTVLLLGVLDFVLSYLNIDLFREIFVNNRILRTQSMSGVLKANYMGIPRIQSVFDEPSYLGRFICLHLPFLYEIKNHTHIFRKWFLKFCTILAWIILFLTMSPIFLVAGISITGVYHFIKSGKSLLKLFVAGCTASILTVLFFYIILNADLEWTFLSRIQATLRGMTSFMTFVYVEPSLANRIINYINGFLVFLKYPVLGTGFGNASTYLYKQFMHSPVPLTYEIIGWISTPGCRTINYAVFWNLLTETGICGWLLFYLFMYRLMQNISKFRKKYLFGNYSIFLNSLISVIFLYVILSIYDSNITECYLWVVIGFIIGITYRIKKQWKYWIIKSH